MSPIELINAAGKAIDEQLDGDTYGVNHIAFRDYFGFRAGVVAVEAVLPLIADILEAEADRRRAVMSKLIGREMTHDTGVGCGVRVAARVVRSLAATDE